MKIFISSLITGMEVMRDAARNAVLALGHQPVMAEDFGARPTSPQVACLDGVRQSDAVVLILGARYGAKQSSGVSATHEEYREARDRRTVFVFVEDGDTRDQEQSELVAEASQWESGSHRVTFSGASNLQQKITRALHDWELATQVAPLNPQELAQRALAALPKIRQNSYSGANLLVVSIAPGPTQPVLRPSEIEDRDLRGDVMKAALFGSPAIFEIAQGLSSKIDGHRLTIAQERGASLSLDEQGTILLTLPIEASNRSGLPVLIEETVQKQCIAAFAFASWLLDRIDKTQRLSHVVITTQICANGALAWRTQREHDASPRSVGSAFTQDERPPVQLNPPHRPRAALRVDARRLVEDFIVLLRRQWEK